MCYGAGPHCGQQDSLPWAPQDWTVSPQNVPTGRTWAICSHRLLGSQVCRKDYVHHPPSDPRDSSRAALRKKAGCVPQAGALKLLRLPLVAMATASGKAGQEARRWSTRRSAAQYESFKTLNNSIKATLKSFQKVIFSVRALTLLLPLQRCVSSITGSRPDLCTFSP